MRTLTGRSSEAMGGLYHARLATCYAPPVRLASLFAGAVLLLAGEASVRADTDADAGTLTGHVREARGRWTADGRQIVTDAVIVTDDGRRVEVTQLGGHVAAQGGQPGLTMRSSHAPPTLRAGDRVTVTARGGTTRRGAPRLAADDVVLLPGGTARFVRTGTTEAGNYLSWPSGCVFMTYANGTGDLAGDREFEVIDEVLATWNDAVASCSYLQLVAAPPVDAELGHDGRNIIRFRDRWCRPATDEDPELCLSAGAAGLTTVIFVDDTDSARDGEIVDADVELNAQHFAISEAGASLGDAPCLADLANTLTHELGHVMGFDHSCLTETDPPKLDGNGAAVPRCAATSDPAIVEATMYPFQDCGETKKASPETDDVAALCAVYDRASDPDECEAAPGAEPPGCCAVDGRGPGPAGAALLAVLCALRLGRRRARRR